MDTNFWMWVGYFRINCLNEFKFSTFDYSLIFCFVFYLYKTKMKNWFKPTDKRYFPKVILPLQTLYAGQLIIRIWVHPSAFTKVIFLSFRVSIVGTFCNGNNCWVKFVDKHIRRRSSPFPYFVVKQNWNTWRKFPSFVPPWNGDIPFLFFPIRKVIIYVKFGEEKKS